MIKMSIIHPSRGRVFMAYNCLNEWMDKADNKDSIEYILSCDIDDQDLRGYEALVKWHKNKYNIELLVCENDNVVQAMNSGATLSTGEILVCVSDDFSCFQGWDTFILNNINHEKEEALSISDGLQQTTNIIMTLPILTRKLYQRLGFIYYHEYTGMMADNDLAERCTVMGVLKTNKNIIFKHNHWVTGMYKRDKTNERHDSIDGWATGRRVLQEQRLINFGIKKTYA